MCTSSHFSLQVVNTRVAKFPISLRHATHLKFCPRKRMYFLSELKGSTYFYTSLCSLNLGALCTGMTIAWPEPSLAYFVVPKERYSKSMEDDSTFQVIMNLGAGIGTLVSMCLVDILGRKMLFSVAGVIDSTGWAVLAIAISRELYMAAAFAGGVAVGTFLTTMALYVAEISSPHNRGAVGALVTFCTYIGVVLTECVAIFANIRIFAFVMIFVTLTFVLCLTFCMAESPYFLYQRGKILNAKISLKALQGAKTILEIDEEFKSMENYFDAEKPTLSRKSFQKVLHPVNTRRSVAIILPLLCISQMLGGHAMDDYAVTVINFVLPNYGKVFLSTLDILSVGVCLYMIEKVGRKPLLLVSVIGSAVCCLVLAIYRFLYQQQCQQVEEHVTVPILIITVYYLVYSLGLIPILPIVTGEIFPSRVKTIAVGLSMLFVFVVATAMQKIYQVLNDTSGACLAFGAFAMLGSTGIPLMIVSLPETKGKSLHQIQGEMEDVPVVIS